MTIATANVFQIWTCNVCLQDRHWGFGRPTGDYEPSPLLWCSKCRLAIRHAFMGTVHSRTGHPNIEWGDYYATINQKWDVLGHSHRVDVKTRRELPPLDSSPR
jgi:hypothetical protein